jgi:hypothetical protein
MRIERQMRLKELMVKMFEGYCERIPGENDEDFLTRCGNAGFDRTDRDKMNQKNGTFVRPLVREKKK